MAVNMPERCRLRKERFGAKQYENPGPVSTNCTALSVVEH